MFSFVSPASTLELRLPPDLTTLRINTNRYSLSFPDGLPKGLKTLSYANFTSPPELPAGLMFLSYGGPTLQSLPASLRRLFFGGVSVNPSTIAALRSLKQLKLSGRFPELPPSLGFLADLDIREATVGLHNLPSRLTTLTLRPDQWTEARDLHKLPPGLISLTLGPGPVDTLAGVPESVVSLHFLSDSHSFD
jgi:hypothetical protein